MQKVKIGDTVRIKRGDSNWVSEMDRFIGREVVVTACGKTKDNFSHINFDGDGNFYWDQACGHFTVVNPDDGIGYLAENLDKNISYSEYVDTESPPRIEKTFTFKKDEYIVILSYDGTARGIDITNDESFRPNFCYKQDENNRDMLSVYKDLRGDANGWGILDPNSPDFSWRYATKDEKRQYDLYDRPFDVKEFKMRTNNYPIY